MYSCAVISLQAIEAAGYAADNVSYGMGGGLLQKVNRDTMSFATKLCHIVYADGTAADIMKQPQTDTGKFSLPGGRAPGGRQGRKGGVGVGSQVVLDPTWVVAPEGLLSAQLLVERLVYGSVLRASHVRSVAELLAVLHAPGSTPNALPTGLFLAGLQRSVRWQGQGQGRLGLCIMVRRMRPCLLSASRSLPGLASPGVLAVKRVNGVPTVFPADSGEVAPHENLLRTVYDMGPVAGVWEEFDVVRARVAAEWTVLPRVADNISASLKEKVRQQMAKRGKVPAMAS